MTERELAQSAARRLAVIRHAKEVSGNIALTCRYYGIARQTFYLWSRRYAELGAAGLRDRSRRPHVSPGATSAEVVGKIVYLRQTYHFGPLKITMYLKRYHELVISPSGVWRILRRLGLNRLPASQRYKRHSGRWTRYEKPEPGHQVQVDVKFIAPLKGSHKKFYQFTAIDDCTRLRVLRIYDRLNQKIAIGFVDYVLQKLPFHVEAIQTDNGSEFQAQFHWHLLDRGIRHVYIKPRTPRLNGKVERSHRIGAEEFYRMLKGVVVDQSALFTTKLQEWEDFYNFDRPHGGLGAGAPVPAVSTIWRMLSRHGLITPEPHKRPRSSFIRFEADLPNELWQTDATHWALGDGSVVEILNIIDDHSRLFVASVAFATVKAADVVATFYDAARAHGFPAALLSDNAAVFSGASRRGKVLLETELERLGISQKHATPYHPQTCGKVERLHQSLKRSLARQAPARSLAQLQLQLDTFRTYYNQQRPHRALGGRTPLVAWNTRLKAGPSSTAAAVHYRVRQDRVGANGTVTLRYQSRLRHISVGTVHKHEPVRLLIADAHVRIVAENGALLRELTIDPSRDYQPLQSSAMT